MKPSSTRMGLVWVAMAVMPLMTGCQSVYRNAEANLPADPDERLAMRVRGARDAAAAGLWALHDGGDAKAAEAASWDLQKASASVSDVLQRIEHDGSANSLHLTFDRASGALERAARALTERGQPDDLATIDGARDSLRAAITEADSFLAESSTAPR
jgi:hypothetical protein